MLATKAVFVSSAAAVVAVVAVAAVVDILDLGCLQQTERGQAKLELRITATVGKWGEAG